MCHRVYVMLSAEERAAAKKLSGYLIPVYASIALAVIAVVMVTGSPQRSELVASSSALAASH